MFFFRTGVFFFLFYFRSGSPVVVGSRWPLLIWWLIVRLTPWPPSPRSFIARPRTLFMIRQILRRRPPTAGRGRPQKKACRRWQITPTFLLLLLLHLLLFRLVFLVFSRSLSLSLILLILFHVSLFNFLKWTSRSGVVSFLLTPTTPKKGWGGGRRRRVQIRNTSNRKVKSHLLSLGHP